MVGGHLQPAIPMVTWERSPPSAQPRTLTAMPMEPQPALSILVLTVPAAGVHTEARQC